MENKIPYQVTIRQEVPGDYNDVYKLNVTAFGRNDEAELVEALRKNHSIFVPELSIVATENNQIIGHILFTKIQIKDADGNLNESLGLAPMAVRPELQKKGIGGQMIKKGFEVAKRLGFKSIIVLGHENYYPKFGFQSADKWKILAPFQVPSNVFMAIELVVDGLKNISGTVIYPKEFETV
ncbi:acetyltransferase, GNAT family [Indibacter alkaliphilus LW1]|uniref:Acetyltransferase, GNAT family n=1 Tax=Indibacter alkaliphilus (strain CCUG 57479 / KCTC 22604 / LW1) TaxID=1189612 RepID=S2E079_INDAL|nr:acetyltransferase, GNAT family [Indibacter alkaliphilus LW1]